jgi:hydrogenase expression/formation protein HypE
MTKTILLDHGSGGLLTHQLIQDLFVKHFHNDTLNALTDSALLELDADMLAFTTDSYVVKPIFFPGGNIGKLSVCGTLNDLAVAGARPLYLSVGCIIEEGFAFEDLEKIVLTMSEEANKADVRIVTGDTKVVEKGACDKLFINTAGIGIIDMPYRQISIGKAIRVGDAILINGCIADHGMAVLGKRHELDFTTDIVSDCAALHGLIATVLPLSSEDPDVLPIHFMRDATRGGLATVLCELAQHHNVGIELDETAIPVRESVLGLCELLGFDPLYVANEGKVVMVVKNDASNAVLDAMRQHPLGEESAAIGKIVAEHPGKVILHTAVGGKRIVDMLSGAQLPRIC